MFLPALFLFATGPKVDLDVVYSHVGDVDLKMDIYYPTTSSSGAAPAVVVIHGGSWMFGKRQDMAQASEYIASQGALAATVEYRLAPKSKWPAMLDDCQTAVRYLRANASKYNIDPKRIGAAGASAGGHLSLFLGSTETHDPAPTEFKEQSSKVECVLDLFGPTDMSRDFPDNGLVNFMYKSILGKERKDAAEDIKKASPLNFIDKSSAPVFIIQGLADTTVDPNQSKILEQKYKDLGIPVEARYIENMKHELPIDKPEVKKAFADGVAWLLQHLSAKRQAA